MSGIRLINEREVLIPFAAIDSATNPTARTAATSPIYAPTADKDAVCSIASWINGRIKAFKGIIAAVGVAGNSVDLKEQWWFSNKGLNFAADVQATDKLTIMDLNLAPDYLPVAGTEFTVLGLPGANGRIRSGDILALEFDTAGTLGTATRALFTPLALILEADVSIDPLHSSNKR